METPPDLGSWHKETPASRLSLPHNALIQFIKFQSGNLSTRPVFSLTYPLYCSPTENIEPTAPHHRQPWATSAERQSQRLFRSRAESWAPLPLQPLAQRRFQKRSEARQGLWEVVQLRKLQERRMTPGGKPRKLQRRAQKHPQSQAESCRHN
ncbi:hypothetical protein FOXG_00369 [Fusarium oxysporum f. sp. lycopersici 4287]|uniref:Uncharacterized protein n=1 Tax=Fusarium oxysporum f. sp. lycopersici (strain 4287 / CBS 123668 / FGSC 9935 / NRRL 34936) TaxID=426428 RepID=A0A0J9WG14_FUSO4|nr:hypothetical protein FOXG_00369 [Fusarium oxysporum f. sp. lycopersici 4287]XP_018232283.1 hypothetical protein FOXG_00369 [Fusarium oxysporum f. sp. lycopersici 4287]KNA94236.1 hypothetical protein FOXG_00369 [Fusarium oxysporum f. sp. lycopersici 4287]KNA94237.1 hypothetical protein FOXG_00369 [Fusarium oxysporum f. sp. lycopersici 4287]